MKRQGTRPIYTSLLAVLVTLGAVFGVIALSSSAGAAATQHSSTAGTAKGGRCELSSLQHRQRYRSSRSNAHHSRGPVERQLLHGLSLDRRA